MAHRFFQTVLTVNRFDHLVTGILEAESDHFSNRTRVIDREYGFGHGFSQPRFPDVSYHLYQTALRVEPRRANRPKPVLQRRLPYLVVSVHTIIGHLSTYHHLRTEIRKV
ncbi:MAG: hypothetical protein Tsb0026_21040 [Sulfuricaulis sp.]